MNQKQKIVLSIGVVLMVLALLVPPWRQSVDVQQIHNSKSIGFGLIFSPPAPDIPEYQRPYCSTFIEFPFLLTEILVIAVGTVAVVAIQSTKK